MGKRVCACSWMKNITLRRSENHTRMYLRGAPIDSVMHRGRWRSSKSACHCIQESRALLVRNRMPERVLAETKYH